jgi:hypothetical protein
MTTMPRRQGKRLTTLGSFLHTKVTLFFRATFFHSKSYVTTLTNWAQFLQIGLNFYKLGSIFTNWAQFLQIGLRFGQPFSRTHQTTLITSAAAASN